MPLEAEVVVGGLAAADGALHAALVLLIETDSEVAAVLDRHTVHLGLVVVRVVLQHAEGILEVGLLILVAFVYEHAQRSPPRAGTAPGGATPQRQKK